METETNGRDYRVVVLKTFLAFWFFIVLMGVYAGL